jgi:hypothetical protein
MMAWFLGVVMTLTLSLVVLVILKTDLNSFFNIEKKVEIVEILQVPSIVAARPIVKGSILEADDLKVIMVPEEQLVAVHYKDKEELIGQKLIIDVDMHLTLTPPMFIETALIHQNLRLYEFGFVELTYLLNIGDMVDIRIAFPTGHDYVVLSKKEVKGYERSTESVHRGLLNLVLEEEEILRMSSALVDTYLTEGAKVYMVKYVYGEHQEGAIVTYPVNNSVLKLYKNNPNIATLPDVEGIFNMRKVLDASLLTLLDEDGERFANTSMVTPTFTKAETSPIDDMEVTSPEEVPLSTLEVPSQPTESKETQTDDSLSGF